MAFDMTPTSASLLKRMQHPNCISFAVVSTGAGGCHVRRYVRISSLKFS
jgi:hypothetical protein